MSHAHASVYLHVVFATKGRRPLIEVSFRDRLYSYMCGIAKKEFGRVVRIGGTENHVHALITITTRISIGTVMSKWKSLSCGWVRRTFPGVLFGWQEGYGAFSVSKSIVPKVETYIERQPTHHAKQTFEQEFVETLELHEIEYDPKELWTEEYAN